MVLSDCTDFANAIRLDYCAGAMFRIRRNRSGQRIEPMRISFDAFNLDGFPISLLRRSICVAACCAVPIPNNRVPIVVRIDLVEVNFGSRDRFGVSSTAIT